MADDVSQSGLEQAANAAHANATPNAHAAGETGHEKPAAPKKPLTTLESVVDETSNLFGNTIKLGLAGAIPYTFTSLVPSMKTDTAVITGAQIASDYTTAYQRGKKYTAGSLLESAVLGTATTPVIETMFRTTNSIATNSLSGYLAKGAVWGGIMYPGFVGAYLPIAYLVRNRTFKGLGKYLKENYWKTLKESWTKLLPFSLMNIFFAPSYLQIPISAAISYVFDRFAAPPKTEIPEDQKRDKTPYLVAAPTAAAKLVRNSVKGMYDAVYAIGSSISDIYKSAAKTTTPTQPAPAH